MSGELDIDKSIASSDYSKEIMEDLGRLNEYQQAAVFDYSRVLLVNANVGSGKTTVLINKVLYLHFVKGVPLETMVVLTFTNKAADEIKSRITNRKHGINKDQLKYFGTFHSVARALLSQALPIEELGYRKNFSIYDNDEMVELYEGVIKEHKLSVKYRSKIRKRIEKYKQGKLLYGSMKKDDDLCEFIELLNMEKLRRNVMEFDDLIENSIKLLKTFSFEPLWLIVDEFQDCDMKQLELIDCLSKAKTKIFAVGDPNQVIYSWRGSSLNVFDAFKRKHNAAVLSLPINYRSTSNILNAARVFMDSAPNLSGTRGNGSPIRIKKHHNTFNEAMYLCDKIKELHQEGIEYKDIAILYRKQKQSEVFCEVFERNHIPYEATVKKSIREVPVLYWVFRLLKASVFPEDISSLNYVVENKRYGTGINGGLLEAVNGFENWCTNLDAAEEKLSVKVYNYFNLNIQLHPTSVDFGKDRELVLKYLDKVVGYVEYRGVSFFEGVREYLMDASLFGVDFINSIKDGHTCGVRLMTIHSSKGLEFRYVFISGVNLGMLPLANCGPLEEEEKRLFYVGITRAKDFVEISYHAKPEEFGVFGIPSPFLRMIPQELVESEELGSRASELNNLRREIKKNIELRESTAEADGTDVLLTQDPEVKGREARHDKYGKGLIVSEDEDSITVKFDAYGEKVFSKAFCTLEFL